jgi:hypothetical protein
MARFHISRDETGYFQLSYENDSGELTLVSDQFESPKQLIDDAVKMATSGEFAGAVVVVDPSPRAGGEQLAAARALTAEYRRPAARKAGE